ncbi:hypothetical protein MNV49_006117 [Pseudohyphozyma bogoriensis]|nr:hypothetical protein MNV49_006117 [Pseudohyphozyma bogoriensis]
MAAPNPPNPLQAFGHHMNQVSGDLASLNIHHAQASAALNQLAAAPGGGLGAIGGQLAGIAQQLNAMQQQQASSFHSVEWRLHRVEVEQHNDRARSRVENQRSIKRSQNSNAHGDSAQLEPLALPIAPIVVVVPAAPAPGAPANPPPANWVAPAIVLAGHVQFPQTVGQMKSMGNVLTNTLLAAYELPLGGTLPARRKAFAEFVGYKI